MATTFSSLWNGIGIVGTLTLNSDGVDASVAVGKEHHPVFEVLSAACGLLNAGAWIGKRGDEACGDVFVDLPVGIQVDFAREIALRDPRTKRASLVGEEVPVDHAAADVLVWSQMASNLVRDEIRIRKEVLARDFALPPCAPVVETQEQGIERLVLGRRRIVPLEQRVAIGELGLPVDAAEFIRRLRSPGVRVQELVIALDSAFQLERKILRGRNRRRIRARRIDARVIALRLELRIGPELQIGRAERGGVANLVLVVRAPETAVRVALRQEVPSQIEDLEGVIAWLEAADRAELPILAGVAPVAASAAAFRRAIPDQVAVTDGVRQTADGKVEHVLAGAERLP